MKKQTTTTRKNTTTTTTKKERKKVVGLWDVTKVTELPGLKGVVEGKLLNVR